MFHFLYNRWDIAYSPSGRYGCRETWHRESSAHLLLINDFKEETIHELTLISNFNSSIHYVYWMDDEHLCVVYKKHKNGIFDINAKEEREYVRSWKCNRECRMLYRIDLSTEVKEYYPVEKQNLKANPRLNAYNKFSNSFVTIGEKEYVIMYYDPFGSTIYSLTDTEGLYEDVAGDRDPSEDEPKWNTTGNQPEDPEESSEYESDGDEEETENETEEDEYDTESVADETTRTIGWFRFIPRNFEEQDELPDMLIDMKETFEALGIEFFINDCRNFIQHQFCESLFAYGPNCYMYTIDEKILFRMNLQVYFDSILNTGRKPAISDFCERIELEYPASDRWWRPHYPSNNGYLYTLYAKHNLIPWISVNFLRGLKNRIIRRTLRFLSRQWYQDWDGDNETDFTDVGDLYFVVTDIETNKTVGKFKVQNKRDVLNKNIVTVHPSGHLLAIHREVKGSRCLAPRSKDESFRTRYFIKDTHHFKQVLLKPVKSNAQKVLDNPLRPLIDTSKNPKFLTEGKSIHKLRRLRPPFGSSRNFLFF